MPLDSHSYLVRRGWSGSGSGLRHGSLARPLAIPVKRSLAGVGRDRDDAFPFWEHVFAAAASAIRVNVCDSDDDDDERPKNKEDTPPRENTLVPLARTSTGILSHRRPAPSSARPPTDTDSSTAPRHLSLIAIAKRDAARRALYAQFFPGPVIRPEAVVDGDDSPKHARKMEMKKRRRRGGEGETEPAPRRRRKRQRRAEAPPC
jgi:hypothetical protein